jgi:hypothetical protein
MLALHVPTRLSCGGACHGWRGARASFGIGV